MRGCKYLLLTVILALAACTSTPSSEAPSASRNHVANFVSTHMIEAQADIDLCKTCHGADYLGGSVGVSCLACHLSGPPFTIHPASWASARVGHRSFANDFSWVSCATAACHGTDLRGGSSGDIITGPSCFSVNTATGTCHWAGPPAPTATNPDFVHTGTYTDPVEHGAAAKANQVKCLNCHGRPTNIFAGGFVADSLILNKPNGNCAKASCHPAATAHPTAWQGGTDDIDPTYDSTHRTATAPIISTSCGLCHLTTAPGAGLLPGAPSCYSSTFTNANTTLSNCHANGPGPFHDNSQFSWDGTCANCHSGAAIVANVHNNTCLNCHLSASGGGTLRTGTDGDAVGATTASSCLACHGGVSKAFIHHDTANALSGACDFCHADPRPDWETGYNVSRPVSGIPQQLFCIKCHVKPVGTGFVVYQNTYAPVPVDTVRPNGGGNWGVTGDASVAQVVIHSITHTARIDVGNYGVCLGCHASGYVSELSGNPAPHVQVWHARPVWNKTSQDTINSADDDPFDVMRQAPGRSYYDNANSPPWDGTDPATITRFNIFATGANTGGLEKMRVVGRYDFSGTSTKPYKGTVSENRGRNYYRNYQADANNPWANNVWGMRVAIPLIGPINNPEGLLSGSPQVPVP